MPRVGQFKDTTGDRLTDWIGIGVLTRTFPPDVVDEVVAGCGRTEQRVRLLPARVVVYFVMALTLFAADGYEEVMRRLIDGLAWLTRWQERFVVPSSPAMSKARARLGAEPLEALFRRCCTPTATPNVPGAFYRRWRVVAVDGTTMNTPDTPANAHRWERPSNASGGGAFPQVRLLAAAECGTHSIFAAAFDGINTSEHELLRRICGTLRDDMLVVADRNFANYDLWQAARANNAQLLWRARLDLKLTPLQILPDGSYLSKLHKYKNRQLLPIDIRVIEYTLTGDTHNTTYRLLTSILDPDEAPARDLADLYHRRWEIENTFDEIKTHQLDNRAVLRSRDPTGISQEIWGILCVHHALRALIQRTATTNNIDPTRISFTRTLHAARRPGGGLSPL